MRTVALHCDVIKFGQRSKWLPGRRSRQYAWVAGAYITGSVWASVEKCWGMSLGGGNSSCDDGKTTVCIGGSVDARIEWPTDWLTNWTFNLWTDKTCFEL